MNLGVCLYTAGRLHEAIDACRRAIQLDPDSFVSHWALGIALGLNGRFEEAVLSVSSRRQNVAAPRARSHRTGGCLRTGAPAGGGHSPSIAS